MKEFVAYLYDEYYAVVSQPPAKVLADAPVMIERYLATRDFADQREAWFDKVRQIAGDLGYALKPKDYKQHPDDYPGSIADITTVLRIGLTGKSVAPDLLEIEQVLGERRARARLTAYQEKLA
jgi:glutamyl-tRNA synthetase